MIIDAHAHVLARCSERFPRRVSTLYPAEREAPAEQLLGLMDRNEVGFAVLVELAGQRAYLLDCLHRYPSRFKGVLAMAPNDSLRDALPREHVPGLVGIRLFELGDPAVASANELPSFGLLQELRSAGLVLSFYGAASQLTLLDQVLAELPDLVVLLNHLGMPRPETYVDARGRPHCVGTVGAAIDATLALARHVSVHVALSGHYAFSQAGYPYPDLRPAAEALLEAFGPGRLLFGSDFPWTEVDPGYGACLSIIDEHLPMVLGRDRGEMLGGTAARLFGLEG